MKDDPELLDKLLRLDGRALRYASRKLRGERFNPWGGKNMGSGVFLPHLQATFKIG